MSASTNNNLTATSTVKKVTLKPLEKGKELTPEEQLKNANKELERSRAELNRLLAEKQKKDPAVKTIPEVFPKAPNFGLFGEDTNSLLRVMGGSVVVLVVLYLCLLGLFGSANDSVKLIFNSFPLRMYINLLIVVIAIITGFIGLRLLFPEQYKYVHSKINSLCSPSKDWEASSPEFRLRFASEQLWRFAFLFVLALMVIFT